MATNEPKYVTEPILTYYDAKIKKYIDEKAVQPQVELERRLDAVEKEAAVNAANITAHREELDDLEQDVRDLRAAIEHSSGGSGSNSDVTKEYVDAAIETAIESLNIPDTDNLVTKEELSAALEELPTEEDLKTLTEVVANVEASLEEKANKEDIPSIEGLATEEFVLAKIAEAELNDKDVDLSAYYTKTEVDALIPDVSGLATKTELEEAINNIEHPTVDLEGYATEEFVTEAIAAIPPVDLSEYAKKTDVPSIEGLASETYVDEKVASIVIPEVPTRVSELENDAGYVTEETLSNYVTKDDTANFASVDYVTQQITAVTNNIENTYVTNETLTQNYTTTEQLEADYVTNETVTEIVTEQIETTVTEQIETKVTEVINQKVADGEIAVTQAESVSYDTF